MPRSGCFLRTRKHENRWQHEGRKDSPALKNDYHDEYECVETDDHGDYQDDYILPLALVGPGQSIDRGEHGEFRGTGCQVE